MPRYKRKKIIRRQVRSRKRDFNKGLRPLSLALIVVISTVFLFGVVYFWQFWQAKRGLAFSTPNDWEKQSLNFLLAGVDNFETSDSQILFLKLFHIDKGKKETTIFSLPIGAKVEVYPSFGTYKFSQVYALGGFAGARNRLEVLTKTANRFLGFRIDGAIIIKDNGQNKDWPVSLTNLKFWPKILLQKGIKTDINFLQLLEVSLKNLTNFENKEIEFSKNIYSQYFFDEEIIKEGKKVLILNNTNIVGLAGKASQYLENVGIKVLDASNFEENYQNKKSFIITSEKKNKTLAAIADILEISEVSSFDNFDISSFYKRADIVVVLGVDKKDFF